SRNMNATRPPNTCSPWNPVGMKNTEPYALECSVSPSCIKPTYSYPWPQTKYRPIRNVSTYHSRRPHLATCQIRPDRRTWPRSTANTPSWQVTLDSRRTVVLIEPRVRSRCAPGHLMPSPLSIERIVKYIANSAAKNISSEDSQMIVPTLTRLGL